MKLQIIANIYLMIEKNIAPILHKKEKQKVKGGKNKMKNLYFCFFFFWFTKNLY